LTSRGVKLHSGAGHVSATISVGMVFCLLPTRQLSEKDTMPNFAL